MPVFNEQEGLIEFLKEMQDNFEDLDLIIVVCDDCSTDLTRTLLSDHNSKATFGLQNSFQIKLIENQKNLGHGPSFLRAAKFTLSLGVDFLITVDGDGQFSCDEIRAAFNYLRDSDGALDLVEGVRSNRQDPHYRKFVSATTRLIVFGKTGKLAGDANTPLRLYRANIAAELFDKIPEVSLVPNMQISILSRKMQLNIAEYKVKSRDRRGASSVGTMWRTSLKNVPSKRFLKFCVSACREIFFTAI